jgi:hypothetical protein
MTEEPLVDDERVARRAELLPEEKVAGSDDAEAQAESILAESEERIAQRAGEASGEGDDVERRTSEEQIARRAGEASAEGDDVERRTSEEATPPAE